MISTFHQAEHGDFFVLRLNSPMAILVDSGTAVTSSSVVSALKQLFSDGFTDLYWVITHNHDDHYGGLAAALKRNAIDVSKIKFIYNEPLSITGLPVAWFCPTASNSVSLPNIEIQFLTPFKEVLNAYRYKRMSREIQAPTQPKARISNDYSTPLGAFRLSTLHDLSETNATSISFVLTYEDKRYLYLGDIPHRELVTALKSIGYNSTNRLKLAYMKVSHHGSRYNISKELLDIVQTDTFVFSANGIGQFVHPDKETIAHILRHRGRSSVIKLYFNYGNSVLKSMFKVDTPPHLLALNFKSFYPNPLAKEIVLIT